MKQSVINKISAENIASYDAIADDFSNTRNRPWPEFELFKPYVKPGMQVLDIGCGNGRLFGSLKKKAVNYTGIDNSARLIEIAQEHWGNHTAAPQFITMDMTTDDRPSVSYDIIFFIASLQHIPSYQLRQKVVQRWSEKIKLGGYCIMINWNRWQPQYRKYIFRNWLQKLTLQSQLDWNDTLIPWRGGPPRYYHAFTHQELRRLIHGAGLRIVEQKKTGFNYLTIAQKPLK